MVDTLGKTHQWWIRGWGESPLRKSPMAQHFLIFMLFFFKNLEKLYVGTSPPGELAPPPTGNT